MNEQPERTAFDDHDHRVCAKGAMAAAESLCREAGLRLTPLRARVLEILLEEHRAMGAYEVLERLREEGLGSQPPTAYRTLDFLVDHGLAHRIEKLNAYLACGHPGRGHNACFLICQCCKRVAEVLDGAIDTAVNTAAGSRSFTVERTVMELIGVCHACQRSAE